MEIWLLTWIIIDKYVNVKNVIKFLLKFLNLAGNNFYLENIILFTSKKKILSYNSQK